MEVFIMDEETHEISPSHRYLRDDEKEAQKKEMRDWFFERYDDPIDCCPYESAEGGYQWIWGGPYRAQDILESEFSDVFSGEVIDELVEELNRKSLQWSGNPSNEEYDETLFDDLAQNTQAIESFKSSLYLIRRFLQIEITAALMPSLQRLLYVNVITVLETYLFDTFIHRVSKDKKLMQRFIETCPDFQQQKIPLSTIYEAVKEVEGKAKSYLLDVVWHNLPRVKPIYKNTFGIDFDNNLMRGLIGEIQKRHDIVHRNGKTKDGHEVTVDVNRLIEKVEEFVEQIELSFLLSGD